MVCISLGNIDKTLIVIFVGCIFCFLNRLLSKSEISKELIGLPILSNSCVALSRFFIVIPFIIVKIRTKDKLTNIKVENRNSIIITHSYGDKLKENAKGKWKFILLSAIVFLINSIFLTESFQIKTIAWIWYILIAVIFYYLIFKVQLYRHHYLSIILIILIGLIIDLISGNLQKEIVNAPGRLVMKFLKQVFFSLYNVIMFLLNM